MKDAFERRALLLHLGTVLDTMNTLLALAASDSSHSVRELAAAHRSLSKHPLLQQIPAALSPQAFAQRASAAFAVWPQVLLEAELDRERLALVVRDAFFTGNEAGWQAYVDSLKAEVAWFGEGLPPMPTEPAAVEPARPRKAAAAATASTSASVDRSQPAAPDEALAGAGVYPSWPWKP
jgi:hypothetical protein